MTFTGEDGTEMTCLCEVRYQVALSYGRQRRAPGNSRGVGLRIVAYETQRGPPAAAGGPRAGDALRQPLTRGAHAWTGPWPRARTVRLLREALEQVVGLDALEREDHRRAARVRPLLPMQ